MKVEPIMIDVAMFDDFKIEAAEMFAIAEDGLLNIDKGLDFTSNYNLVFRSFHSVKGAAGMFDMDDLQNHMHNLETLFEAQKKNGKLKRHQVDYFLKGIDAAKLLIAGEPSKFVHMSLDKFNADDATAATSSAIPKAEAAKAGKVDRKNGVVFIIDDEPELVDVLSRILDSSNYVIHKFYNGQEGLNAFEELKPDIVLTDIMMPKLNGIEMLKEIHKINTNTPVIFISGNLSKDRMLEALQYGAYAFIDKPFNNIAVLNLCRNAVKKSQALMLLERSIKYILYQFSDLETF